MHVPDPQPVMPETGPIAVMVPTRRTQWLRRFLPWQLFRFVAVNLRMLQMIRRAHPHRLPQADAERNAVPTDSQ